MRDSTGALIAAYSEEFPYSGDSLQMAAQSLLKTLHFSQEAGFHKRVVEYTNSQLKDLILSQEECLTELNDLLVLIREFYFSFQQLDFNVISSSCNKAAKALACYTKELTEFSI